MTGETTGDRQKRKAIFWGPTTTIQPKDISFTEDPNKASIFKDEDVKMINNGLLKALQIKDGKTFVKYGNIKDLQLQQDLARQTNVSNYILKCFWLKFTNKSLGLDEDLSQDFPVLQTFNRDITSFIKNNNGLCTKENSLYHLINWSQSTEELRKVFTLDSTGEKRFNFLKQHIAEGLFKWNELVSDEASNKLILELVKHPSYYETYTTIKDVEEMLNKFNKLRNTNADKIKNSVMRKLAQDYKTIRLARNIILKPSSSDIDLNQVLNGETDIALSKITLSTEGVTVRKIEEVEKLFNFLSNTTGQPKKDPEETGSINLVCTLNGKQASFGLEINEEDNYENKNPFTITAKEKNSVLTMGISEDDEADILINSLKKSKVKTELSKYFELKDDKVILKVQSLRIEEIEIDTEAEEKVIVRIEIDDVVEFGEEVPKEEAEEESTDSTEEAEEAEEESEEDITYASETVDSWEGTKEYKKEEFVEKAKKAGLKNNTEFETYLRSLKKDEVENLFKYGNYKIDGAIFKTFKKVLNIE